MVSRVLRAGLAAVALAAGLVLTGAGAAAATPATAPASVGADAASGTGCTTPSQVVPVSGTVVGGGCQTYPDDSYLPVLRWTGAATSLHYKNQNGISNVVSNMAVWLQRDGTWPLWMTIGNTAWSWATSIVSFGVRAQPLEAAGYQVDHAVGILGNKLTTTGVVAFLVAVAALSILWRAWRQHRMPWAQAGRVVLVVGVMVAMTVGAQSSQVVNGNYVAGTMSPGWAVNLINTTVSTVASAPAAALEQVDWTSDLNSYGSTSATTNGSCKQYVTELYKQYTDGANGDGKVMAAISVDMSRLWEQTGLQAWRTAQFGAANPYGDYAYCRLLEMKAGISATDQISLTNASGAKFPKENVSSGAWGTGDDEESLDRSLVAWAACRPSADGSGWTVASDFGQVDRSRGAVTADDCAKWWSDDFFNPVDYTALAKTAAKVHVKGEVCAPGAYNGSDCWIQPTAEQLAEGGVCAGVSDPTECVYVNDDGSTSTPPAAICTPNATSGDCLSQSKDATGGILKDDSSPLYWGGSATDAMNETASAPLVRNFMLSLHGSSNLGGSLAVTLTYTVASLVVLVVFGALGLGVFIAKLWALVMMIAVLFTLLSDVVFTGEPSSTVKLFKQSLGITFYAFGLQLIFALVTLFTGALVAMATGWFAPGSTESMAWLALSPAVSVIVLHLVFTKTLKLPSPFTVNGVKTWGAAAAGGAVGGALGSGIGRMAVGHVRRAGSSLARGAGDAALGWVGLGALRNRGKRPGSFAAPAAAGAGAGAAAGAVTGSWAARRQRPGARTGAPPALPPVPSTGGPARPMTSAERASARHAEQEALVDGAQMGVAGTTRHQLAAARDERRAEAVWRRGYGQRHPIAGDVREAVSARTREQMTAAGERFRTKPIRSGLGLAAKTAGAAAAVVGTGGLALPFLAAGWARREIPRAATARRRVIDDEHARWQAQKAAADAAEAERTRRELTEQGNRPVRVQTGWDAALPASVPPPRPAPYASPVRQRPRSEPRAAQPPARRKP